MSRRRSQTSHVRRLQSPDAADAEREVPTWQVEEAVEVHGGTPALLKALDRLEELHERRKELAERKKALLKRKKSLARIRGEVWRVAVVAEQYRGELGRVELRDEAAIVDQYVFVKRNMDPAQTLVNEDLDLRDDYQRDRRAWTYLIQGERTFVRKIVRPQERFVQGMIDAQRRFLEGSRARLIRVRHSRPTLGRVLQILAFAPLLILRLVLKLQELVLLNLVRGQRSVADTAVDLPINVQVSLQTTREELSTTESRRKLRLAMLNERLLTPERRKVLVFLAATLLVVGYLFTEIVIRIFRPELIPIKRQSDIVFFYSIGTRLILPTPWELVLLTATPILGFLAATLLTALGGVVGSWLLFLVGAQASEGLHKLAQKRAWLQSSLKWMEAKGPRYGYPVMFVLLAIPFSVDSIAALASVFKLRLDWFLVITFFSTIVRAILFLTLFG